jgi:hypothetical protein
MTIEVVDVRTTFWWAFEAGPPPINVVHGVGYGFPGAPAPWRVFASAVPALANARQAAPATAANPRTTVRVGLLWAGRLRCLPMIAPPFRQRFWLSPCRHGRDPTGSPSRATMARCRLSFAGGCRRLNLRPPRTNIQQMRDCLVYVPPPRRPLRPRSVVVYPLLFLLSSPVSLHTRTVRVCGRWPSRAELSSTHAFSA